MSGTENGTTVAVTSKGQATIPKELREKLRIDTPGRVRFVENEVGEVVIRPVKRPSELRGELGADADDEESATALLRADREHDRQELDESRVVDGDDE